MSAGAATGEHLHVSAFAGAEERFVSGLVLHSSGEGWIVEDELGEIGPAGRRYGAFPSQEEACREALRLLRARYGPPLRACWGAGAPNDALRELGYQRGTVGWRWWPPGFHLSGASEVGPDGGPVAAKTTPIRWPRLDATVSVAVDDVEGFTAFSYPPGARRAHRRSLGRYARDVVLRGRSRGFARKPIDEVRARAPAWFQHLQLVFSLLVWVLERAPEIGRVRSLRFVNPPSGSCFIDEDTAIVEGDVVDGAVRRAVGNKMENGVLLVNEEVRVPFSCDCLGKVVVFAGLPRRGAYLVPRDLDREVGARSRLLRVPVELRIDLPPTG